MNMIVTKQSKIEQALAKIPTARTEAARVPVHRTHAKTISKNTCRDIREVVAEAILGCVEDYELTMESDPSIIVEVTISSLTDGQQIERAEFKIGKPRR
jgi:hypothetical protein